MTKSLLDTDTLSEINKARDHVLLERASRYLTDYPMFTISAVTVMEIVRGYYLADRLDKLAEFSTGLATQEVLPFTSSLAELAGKIDAELQKGGQRLGALIP